jgi:hypothetical protein
VGLDKRLSSLFLEMAHGRAENIGQRQHVYLGTIQAPKLPTQSKAPRPSKKIVDFEKLQKILDRGYVVVPKHQAFI